MNILGLTGYKQSGKDTVCNILRQYLASQCIATERVAFADALKLEASRVVAWPQAKMEQHKEIFRPFLQWWGTDFRRRFYGEDYWIKRWQEAVLPFSNYTGLIIVPDVRFVNEAKTITDMGGEVFRVSRHLCNDTHISEIELRDYVFQIIDNTGTIERLTQETIKAYGDYIIRHPLA